MRGRKPIAITEIGLRALILDVESAGGYANRSALWAAVENHPTAKKIGLKAQTAMIKAKVWNIEPITPIGQRGRTAGEGMPDAVASGVKRKRKRIPLTLVDKLKGIFPAKLHPKVDRAAKGSLKAAVALKCLDCCCGSKKEVRLCTVYLCPLWAFRPYQSKPEGKTNEADLSTAGV